MRYTKLITALAAALFLSSGSVIHAAEEKEERTLALSVGTQYRYNAMGGFPSNGLGTYVGLQYDDGDIPLLVGIGAGFDRSALVTDTRGCTELSMKVGYRVRIRSLQLVPGIRFGCILSNGQGGAFSAVGLTAEHPVGKAMSLYLDSFYHYNPFTILLKEAGLCSATVSFGVKYYL